MKDRFCTARLINLLQKYSFYEGKLSTIQEIDHAASSVYMLKESVVLGRPVYYHTNTGEPMIDEYKKQGFFNRDAEKFLAIESAIKEIINTNNFMFGFPSKLEIEDFSYGFQDEIIDVLATEEGMKPSDIYSNMYLCQRLGLINQLTELLNIPNINHEIINNMICGEAVNVEYYLKYSDDYDLAYDLKHYADVEVEDEVDVCKLADKIGNLFDQEVAELTKQNKVKIKKMEG